MTIRDAIQTVVHGGDLTEPQAVAAATALIRGEASEAQVAALLIGLRMKGETVAEIVGFARAARSGATPLQLARDGVIDCCGTGGDGHGTFNVSTACAFVAAAAGCRVAKHGNRAISSQCGSADVLDVLGIPADLPSDVVARCIDEVGVGFLFAPAFHPGLRHAGTARREIGVRTILNGLGPLTHPAGARRQVLGVYDGRLTQVFAQVLNQLGSTHCMVVHGDDGLDEITLSAATQVSELRDGAVTSYSITPEQFGIERAPLDAVRGGDGATNAALLEAVLAGEPGPRADIVRLNAGAAIYVGGGAASLSDGVAVASEVLRCGAGLAVLRRLQEIVREATA